MEFFIIVKEKIKARLAQSPTYAKFIRVRDIIAGYVLKGLLAFFNAVGPLWSFLFVKKSSPENTNGTSNKISFNVIKFSSLYFFQTHKKEPYSTHKLCLHKCMLHPSNKRSISPILSL